MGEKLAPRRPAALAWSAAAAAIVLGMLAFCPWYFAPIDPIDKVTRIYGNCPFGESLAVADFLRDHSAASDTIFIYGSEPQIFYYADRKSASRYIFAYPLMTPFADTRDRQAGVIREFDAARPRFVVVACQGSSFLEDDQTPRLLPNELSRRLMADYCPVGFVDLADRRVRPIGGKIVLDEMPRPDADHTLAVWERTAR